MVCGEWGVVCGVWLAAWCRSHLGSLPAGFRGFLWCHREALWHLGISHHTSGIENTDVFGLQAAYLKEVDNAQNKKALVIGAGGVSPSVILSLQKSGVNNISITNNFFI